MADINSSLVGFLKKKSLFANSPDKNKKPRQLSRQAYNMSESQKSHKIINYNPERNFDSSNTKSSKNLQKHNSVQNFASMAAEQESIMIESPIRHEFSSIRTQQRPKQMKRNFNFTKNQQPQPIASDKYVDNSKNSWIGIVSKAITFESARIESAQCLDNMAVKLQTEISTINYKIDAFRSKVSQILEQQFQVLREKIDIMVNGIIQESQNNIRAYIQSQQRTLASDLIAMRETLIREYQKIEQMKEEINKPSWRKVAGELLASQLQDKIQDIIHKSKSLSVKHWELRNFGEDKLPALERELRNVVKLGYT